ncbi:MAG: SurA N-terminal domain-containing protein [Alphaproteobacteria bacterium]|nr:SurA N-terminal domain-containing protein [Alphaproteobacteria bacterium]OJV12247.1 MAG: hypothetical protein BGO27_05880 [Alphaproteobacteria bacterium 33-17]
MKSLILLSVLFTSHTAYSANVVARVDEKVITENDVLKRTHMLNVINPEFQRIPKPQALSIALEQIINEYAYKKEGKRLKIELDNDEKTKSIAFVEEENKLPKGGFNNFIKSQGLDPAHVRDHLETQMLWQKIIYQHIKPQVKITDNEIKSLVTNPNSYKFNTITIVANNTADNQSKLSEISHSKKTCSTLSGLKDKNLQIIKQNLNLTEFRPEYGLALTTQKVGTISNIINIDDKISLIAVCDKTVAVSKQEMQEIRNHIGGDKMMALANLHLNKAKRKLLIEKY